MKYTAGQAAKATGLSTATITRALKSGKISGEKDINGAWSIEPSELHRVFPPIATQGASSSRLQDHAIQNATSETPENHYQITALEREVRLLKETLEDLKGDRDKWRDMAERLSLAPPKEEAARQPATFWKALFKR